MLTGLTRELLTNGIDGIMPECPAEAILVSIATAATLAVRYSPILSELVTTEAKIRILNTRKSIARLLAGM